VQAGLQEAEVVAVRLYTGPTCLWYNAALRGFPAAVHATLAGNRREATIFCLVARTPRWRAAMQQGRPWRPDTIAAMCTGQSAGCAYWSKRRLRILVKAPAAHTRSRVYGPSGTS
jgi:hypothetical protein